MMAHLVDLCSTFGRSLRSLQSLRVLCGVYFLTAVTVAVIGVHGVPAGHPQVKVRPLAAKYKPVVLVHGILASADTLRDLVDLIHTAHPGTNVSVVPLYEELDSLKSLWQQVPRFAAAIRPIMQAAPNGIILVCYSQGGITCRGILETVPDHNVHTFISLSAPQMGQYGDTSFIPVLPKMKEEVYRFCYLLPYGQDISVCNYWNDPHEQALYLQHNNYLPLVNNETMNAKSKEWKANFLRIKQLVLIGGPDDGVITPWQSSQFGFYDEKDQVVEMKQQKVYKYDSFGLRTLDERKAIQTYTIAGVHHIDWHGNKTVFDCCIEPWLV